AAATSATKRGTYLIIDSVHVASTPPDLQLRARSEGGGDVIRLLCCRNGGWSAAFASGLAGIAGGRGDTVGRVARLRPLDCGRFLRRREVLEQKRMMLLCPPQLAERPLLELPGPLARDPPRGSNLG